MTGKTDPRWWQFVHANRIRCPAGHKIPNTFIIMDSGFVRCAHIINRHDRVPRENIPSRPLECGLWLFVLAVRGGGMITVAISLEDMSAMDGLTTPTEFLDYLGILNR